MKSVDIKSLAIGILGTALVAVLFGAGPQQQAAPARYQVSYMNAQHILVLDNQTNRATVLFKKPIENVVEWPWTNEYSFSLEDAINKPAGAEATIGAGHPQR